MKTGDPCPKCESGTFDHVRYVPARLNRAMGAPDLDERLSYECSCCGYKHYQPTADARKRQDADMQRIIGEQNSGVEVTP